MGAVLSTYAGSNDIASFASTSEEDVKEYDYVICGGGTAGCVLASRLSEDSSVSVLVIEAGESDARQLHSRLPAAYPKLYKSAADWNFTTIPQPEAAGREMYWPRGKMLGGCSAINAQIYQRCAPSDYDDWEAKGAEGWNWAAMKPYFHKAEHFTPNPDYEMDIKERGSGGFWKTSYPPTSDLSKDVMKSIIASGIPFSPDLNVERHASGVSRFIASVDNGGTRSSTSAAYLPAAVFNRPNLHILTSSIVTRLVLEGTGGISGVRSVEIAQSTDGPRHYVRASREVLVCLGSIGSPQLLLASGIGPKSDLSKLDIETLVDLDGVGKSMRDHPACMIPFRTKPGTSGQYLVESDLKSIPALARWMYDGRGPLGSNGAEIGAFLRSDDIPGQTSSIEKGRINASGPDAPDLELINTCCYYMNHTLDKPAAGPGGDYLAIAPVVLRPKSTGTITLRTSNTFDAPLIDPAYFTDKEGLDKQVMLEGVKLTARVAALPPLCDSIIESVLLGSVEDKSDEELMEYISRNSETLYHPMCTCKIGPRDDGGVVDSALKVYGVSDLRVCDASVFPDAVSGHPQAAVVAVAEKCADLLKGL